MKRTLKMILKSLVHYMGMAEAGGTVRPAQDRIRIETGYGCLMIPLCAESRLKNNRYHITD